MVRPVGHEALRRKLERHLPPVTLLQAPKGVGAWQLGEYLLRFHGVITADMLMIPKLDASAARDIRRFLQTTPHAGKAGLLINVDTPPHMSAYLHETALNTLLWTLEDPNALIILVSSEAPMLTAASRAVMFRLGLLSDGELMEVLLKIGMSEGMSTSLRGSTAGMHLVEQEAYLKPSVDAMLKALQERDRALFDTAIKAWRDPADGKVGLRMLKGWIYEALTNDWQRYAADPAPLLAKDSAKLKAMLVDLDQYDSSSPKILARAALDKHMGA